MGKKRGAPSKYSEALADRICREIATRPVSLVTICRELDLDPSTVYDWRNRHEDFANKYARARDDQADLLAEEILEIADDSSGDLRVDEDGNETLNTEFVQRSRLRVDARKWLASKLKPKKYGDSLKLDGEINVKHGLADKLAAAEKRVSEQQP